MSEPILSVKQEGQKIILSLQKSDGTPVIEKALNKRTKPGLESGLDPKDLEEFKETIGAVIIELKEDVG